MNKKLLIYLVLAVVLAIPLINPLFQHGFFESHDGEWAIVRLTEMHRELKGLQFPPQWSTYLNHGYGYPLFLFTYPFPYYLGEVIHLLGYTFVDSVKIVFILSTVFSSLFMFLFARELIGDLGGLVTAVFYVYSPFRMVNLYVRGSIGESLSLALFPLLFYLSLKFLLTRRLFYLYSSIPALAVMVLTHNIMAIIFVPLWLLWLFFMTKSYYENLTAFARNYILPVMVLGLGISAYFWVPAILEKNQILLSAVPLADKSGHFVGLADFLNSPWRYGLLPSFQLGWAHLLLFLIGILAINLSGRVVKEKYEILANYFTLIFLILIFLTMPVSYILWNLPPLSSIDFPWRLLNIATFFLASGIMFASANKKTIILVIPLTLITITGSLYFAKPARVIDRTDDYYATNDATTTSMDELTPVWVKDKPQNRPANLVEFDGRGTVLGEVKEGAKSVNFEMISYERMLTRVNMIYFPGWKTYIDGKETEIIYKNPKGIISFIVPTGEHQISLVWSLTRLRLIALIITIISAVITLLLFTRSLIIRQI